MQRLALNNSDPFNKSHSGKLSSPYNANYNFYNAKEIKVEDGDTFVLPSGDVLRLKGGDTPETSIYDKAREFGYKKGSAQYKDLIEKNKQEGIGATRENIRAKKLTQYMGNEATELARTLINESKGVYVKKGERDVYGRYLTDLYTNEGVSIATTLIEEGLATTSMPGQRFFGGTEEDFENVDAMVKAYQEGKGIWANPDAIAPYDFRNKGPRRQGSFLVNSDIPTLRKGMENYVKREGYKSKGLQNAQYAQVLASEEDYFTLPASLGASAHYGRSLNNSLMKQAGYINLASMAPTTGAAETMMEYNNMMLEKEPLGTLERFVARSYDTGLHAPGLGMYLNQAIFIPMGWGRVYKDEKGALPSVLGLAGRILDESYLYYAHMNPDYQLIGQDYSSGLGYGALEKVQNGTGVFQSMFENIGEFGVSVAQSLGMYVAIAQPIDMLKSEMMKSFIDKTLTSTLISNTPSLSTATDVIGAAREASNLTPGKLFSGLSAEWFFGDLAAYRGQEGGLAAAVIKQRFWLDEHGGADKSFFNYKMATTSNPFLLQQMVERGRAANLIESTFKPFLLDIINPYDSTTELGKRSFDAFSIAINEFIEEVARPPDMHLEWKDGRKFQFQVFNYSNDTSEVVGVNYKSTQNPSGVIQKYTDLKRAHTASTEAVNKHMSQAMTELEAEKVRLRALGYSDADMARTTKVRVLQDQVTQYKQVKSAYDNQLGKAMDNMEVKTYHMGADRKTQLAKKMQGILDRMPLNPLKWGVFNQAGLQTIDETTAFGQLFSFEKSAKFVKDLLQGETRTSRIFKIIQPMDGEYARAIDDMGNALVKAVTGVFKNEGAESATRLTSKFRQAERRVQTLAQKKAKDATKAARAIDKTADIVKPKGISFIATNKQAARRAQTLGAVLVEDGADEIFEAVAEYQSKIKQPNLFDDAYIKMFETHGITSMVDDLQRATKSFSKNVTITDGLGKATGYVAATLFGAILLNNVLQSTQGSSITTQLSMALFGEDEGITVKFQGNRFLPTEMIAETFGMGSTGTIAINAAFDIATAGFITYGSHQIAKLTNGVGAMQYTLTQAAVDEMITGDKAKFILKLGDDAVKPGVALKKGAAYTLESAAADNKKAISLIVDEMGSFKTGRIAQEITSNIGTKTLVFATIGLLAVNSMRETGAIFLNKMIESEQTTGYLTVLGGTTLAGGVVGGILDYRMAVRENGTEVAKLAGKVYKSGLTKNIARMGVAGFAIGVGIGVGALVFGGDQTKGTASLDPIAAAVVGGIAGGLLTSSLAVGGVAAVAAFSAMAAINWAGIKFLKVGTQGPEVDEASIRMVSSLGRYSAAVLEQEKDASAQSLAVAAWASKQGSRSTIFAKRESIGDEVTSIARQSPLPFMQFFVNERVTGVDTKGNNLIDDTQGRTERVYSVGVQTGPLFGTSVAVELPVMYTPKKGFMGLSYNPNHNLMFLTDAAVNTTAWAGIAMGGTGAVLAFYGHIFQAYHNIMPGSQKTAMAGIKMLEASKDLFGVVKAVYSAADKINYHFTKTIVTTVRALYGTDVDLGLKVIKNTKAAYQEALHIASLSDADKLAMEIAGDLSPAKRAAAELLASDNGESKALNQAEKALSAMPARAVAKYGGAVLLGAVIGASIADFGYEVYKHFKLQSAVESNQAEHEISQLESELRSRKAVSVGAFAVAGGLANIARVAPQNIINNLLRKASNNIVGTGFANNFGRKIRAGIRTARYVQIKVARSKPIRPIGKLLKVANRFINNRLGGKLGVGIAATIFAYNFVRTSSEFGLTQFMDRHIVYDKNGPVYDNYEQVTKANRLHHTLVAGTLTAGHVGILSLFGRPVEDQKETLLRYAKKEAGEIAGGRTNFLFRALDHTPIGRFREFQRGIEANRLLDTLYNLKYEADQYKLIKDEVIDGTTAKLPAHLKKIKGAIELRERLGGDEIKVYQSLKRAKAAGVGAYDRELARQGKSAEQADELVKNFQRRLITNLGAESGDDVLKAFSKMKGQTAARFSSKVFSALVVMKLGSMALNKLGSLGGDEEGDGSILDNLYKRSNQVGKIGQKRQDESTVGIEGLWSVVADVARITTKRDIVDLQYYVSKAHGQYVKATGQRLVSNAKGLRQLQRQGKELSEMLIIDNPNAYIPLLNFGGKTLRRGERGVTTTSYFQLQGVGQDISAASYSMAAKFIFNQYVGGKGHLSTLISQATRGLDKEASLDDVAVQLRNTTSQLHALKTSRKYSRGTSEVNAQLQGDALAAMIVTARQERLAEIGWQPVDSLFSNMFWETQDKAKMQMGQRNYVRFLSKLAKGDRKIFGIFSNLMGGDLFGNMMRETSIKNIVFFTKGFKPRKKEAAQRVGDIASMWHRSDTIGVQLENYNQQKSNFFGRITSDIIRPITSSGIFQFVPGWLKNSMAIAGSIFATAWAGQQIAAIARNKEGLEGITDTARFFSKMRQGKGIAVAIDSAEDIVKAYQHKFKNDKFSLDKIIKGDKTQGGIAVINKGDNSKLYVGLSDLGTTPGRPAIISFSQALDYMNPEQLQDFLGSVEGHGQAVKNMFTQLTHNGHQRSIELALLDADSVKSSLEGTLNKVRGISDDIKGNTISELLISGKAIGSADDVFSKIKLVGQTEFLDIIDQSLDVVFKNPALLEQVTIEVKGKARKYFKFELMDPNVTEAELIILDSESKGLRKSRLDSKQKAMRETVKKQAKEVLTEEYQKANWSQSGNIADDVHTVQMINKRALDTVTADGTALSQVRQTAGGVIHVEELGRTEARKSAAKAAAKKPKVVHKPNGIIEIVGEAGEDALQYQTAKGIRDGITDQLGKGLGAGMNAFFSLGDVVQGFDIYSAYARVGEAYTSPYATSLDKELAKRELGRAFMSNMLGLGIGYGFGKLSGGVMGKVDQLRKSGKLGGFVFKSVLGAGVGGGIIAAGWKGFVEPGMKAAGNFVEEHNVTSSIKNAWDNAWYGMSDFSGNVLGAPISWAAQAGAPPAVLRGMSHGMGAAAGTGFLIAGLAVSGLITVGLLPALAIAAGVGLMVGGIAMVFGDQMNKGVISGLRDIKNVPYVGGMLSATVTDPYRQIRNQSRFRHHFYNSPFMMGYAGDLINSQWLNVVGAAEDPTGRDMVSFMFGEVLYPAEYDTSAWKKNAADSIIGSPPSLIDQVISNELKIRAEMYSSTVIGRYSWDSIVEHADNNNVIRAQEAAVRADKASKIEQAHANAKKALLSQGGPQQALNAGSSRKSAVTQAQISNVVKFQAALAAENQGGGAGQQVTAVTIASHKSNVENNDATQSEAAKQATLGTGISPPLVLEHQYTQRVYTDDSILAVDFEKDTHDSNALLQADARAFGGDSKGNSPEIKDSVESYNAYKDNT